MQSGSNQQQEKHGGGGAAAASSNSDDASMSTSSHSPSPSDPHTALRLHLLLAQFHRRYSRFSSPPASATATPAVHANVHLTQVEQEITNRQRQLTAQQRQLVTLQHILQQLKTEVRSHELDKVKSNKKRGLESEAEREDREMAATTAASASLSPPSIDELQVDQSSKKQKCEDEVKTTSGSSSCATPAQHQLSRLIASDVQLYSLASTSVNVAAASATPVSLISISVQLVMQFLELKEVGLAELAHLFYKQVDRSTSRP